MDSDDFIKSIKMIMARPSDPPARVVSPKEYDVLLKMYNEGKLSVTGHPKTEFLDEYYKLMSEV